MNKDIRVLNITGTDVSKEDRIIEDHKQLLEIINFFRREGKIIIYTMGGYDIKHVGHERYLQKAKEEGGANGILIVGLDSDEFLKKTKGPKRPVVSYDERSESLVHTRSVNIVTILRTQEEADVLMKAMAPDIVVLSFSSTKDNFEAYEKRMNEKYGPYCGKVKIFERQAETSTSARIRLVVLDGAKELLDAIQNCADNLKEAAKKFFSMHGGEES